MRYFVISLLLLLWASSGQANNVKIDSLSWTSNSVSESNKVLKMTFILSWENSWHDSYNYDAVYVFFKFKKKETGGTVKQNWNHLFLTKDGHTLQGPSAERFGFWLCPLSSPGKDFNVGLYIFHKDKGVWPSDTVRMEVSWNVENQLVEQQLTTQNINDGEVMISAQALEMVYIPRGPFRLGDGVSEKGFHHKAFPLPEKYDIVTTEYGFQSKKDTEHPERAADRINDVCGTENSAWVGTSSGENWWLIDFGAKERKITYFGVNAANHQPTYYPTRFRLEATHDHTVGQPEWVTLWEGPGPGNWVMSKDAYPIEKAIRIAPDSVGSYRTYRLKVLGMNAGYPIVKSIGMTEVTSLEDSIDYTVLLDAPVTQKDSMYGLWADDGAVWTEGRIDASFPNGYAGFYTMKYELSQDQYVRFLNKLNYQQQNAILNDRLSAMKEGDYIFGDTYSPTCRNGIVVETKINGMPVIFSCNLDKTNVAGQEGDGQDVACNFMNMADMLSYADWAGLRPLSEMEYEKMCRRLYPDIPQKGSYPWNTTFLEETGTIENGGFAEERVTAGNANYGKKIGAPVRVGAFARKGTGRERAGASYWGVMDLAGNLAEMYYNVNHLGLSLLATEIGDGNKISGHNTAHGDGSIHAVTGQYDGAKEKRWSVDPAAIGLRGGSFDSEKERLRVSDRRLYTDVFTDWMQRDSSVTFRLGRTAPVGEELHSWLVLENEKTTESGSASDSLQGVTYMVDGNVPEGVEEGVCTYIWYCSENGGPWRVLEGEHDRELYFDKYKNSLADGPIGREIHFKRKVITPTSDSELSSQREAVLYNSRYVEDPFGYSRTEVVTYRAGVDTWQVSCNWDASVPRKWSLVGEHGGIEIDSVTGILSGLNTTLCNVTVAVECSWYPGALYLKKVKENSRDFAYKGSPYTVDILPGDYTFECWGAQGGSYSGGVPGKGGYVKGDLSLPALLEMNLYVGGAGGAGAAGGWNGGGAGVTDGNNTPSYAGGGASDIRVGGTDAKDRIMVAAGGGGTADITHGADYTGNPGGNGGGVNGANGAVEGGDGNSASAARGGTQNAGGAGGRCWTTNSNTAEAGRWAMGGKGNDVGNHTGGGGGGGYYGGGGACAWYQGGGGGGSSFISGHPDCDAVDRNGIHTGEPYHFSGWVFKETSMTSGSRAGHGLIRISVK